MSSTKRTVLSVMLVVIALFVWSWVGLRILSLTNGTLSEFVINIPKSPDTNPSMDSSALTEELQFKAELGETLAQYHLGQRFEQGIGITQNFIGAHLYYNLAASSGITEASEAREQLAKKMSVDELAQARFLATMWEPQDKYEAFYQAANFGDVDTLRKLIKYGVGVNEGDDDGWRGMHYAAINGHLEAVKYLHSVGGKIDIEAKDGVTPLMVATHMNRIAIVKFLLDKNADVLTESEDSVTAVDIAKQNGHTALQKIFTDEEKHNVKSVQARLYDLGYDPGQADGVMGNRTIAAIKKFQKNNDLETHGRVNRQLLNKVALTAKPSPWAALASGKDGATSVHSMGTRRAAEERALRHCNKNYKNCMIETASTGCIALLFYNNGGKYWVTSDSFESARDQGVPACKKYYDNCRLRRVFCASGRDKVFNWLL